MQQPAGRKYIKRVDPHVSRPQDRETKARAESNLNLNLEQTAHTFLLSHPIAAAAQGQYSTYSSDTTYRPRRPSTHTLSLQ
jgi:hypothetical protein